MKAASWILKVAAIVLALAAVTFCVLANLERITGCFLTFKEKVAARRCACSAHCDPDEYEDWGI